MAGYTRNDTPNNIADGNVINASDLDGEFDKIETAFGTSGHTHDGTGGNGPQIGTGGIANDAVTLGTKTSGNYVATGAVSGVGLSGSASAEGATFTVTSNATDANTASTIVARDASGNFSAGTVTASLTGNVTGNAATATALQTARNIAGQSFDGTSDITIASTDLSDSGSIDATTLDSIDSTSFLRSDAADTKTSGNLIFNDNIKAEFGTSSDLQIYHTGGSSIIENTHASNLFLAAQGFTFWNAAFSEIMLNAVQNGAVTLYHNNSAKLATASGGVTVTGELTADTVDATTLQIGNTSVTATAAELNYNDITTLGTVEASKTVTADSSGNVTFPNSEKLLIGTGPAGSIEIYHQALTSSTGISHIEADQELRIKGDGISITDVSIGGGFTITDDGAFITGPLKNTGTLELSGGGIPGVIALSNSLNGTTYGNLKVYPGLVIDAPQINSDIEFTGNDGGTAITALTLDMSDAGTAIFNNDVKLSDSEIQGVTRYTTSLTGMNPATNFAYNISMQMYYDGSDNYIEALGRGSLGSTEDVGDLIIQNTNNDHDVLIKSDDGSGGLTTYFQADGSSGQAKMMYYGSTKIQTTSTGGYVAGNLQITGGNLYGANQADYIAIGANDIDFYINSSNEFRMESDGDFHADGDVIAYSTTVSDERLKTDIEKIENATDKVSQLNGYTFTYKADGKKSAGVIAQEVEKVLPSAVSEKELPLKTDDGVAYKTVQYDQIIGLLIESIKELKQEINELKGA